MKVKASKNKNRRKKKSPKQERDQLHSKILTLVSHELKTPLACIIGSLETYEQARKKLHPDKMDILINTALQESYRLGKFITNTLDLARLESGTVMSERKLCSMNLLLEDCLTPLGQDLHHCDITIKATPSSFNVTTDPLLLIKAVSIILGNAVKYGPAHPVISMECEEMESQVVIRIHDNGPGIPESKLEEIFSKYSHFSRKNQKHAGTGLELPICREIMGILGGTVTAANNADGKGAIFTLAFAS